MLLSFFQGSNSGLCGTFRSTLALRRRMMSSPKAFINVSLPKAYQSQQSSKLLTWWTSPIEQSQGPSDVQPLGQGSSLSPLRSCRHEPVRIYSLQRVTSTFISTLTLSCSEDDGIRSTSEVGPLDAFASSLPLSSRVISYPAYDEVTGGHVHDSKCRGPDSCTSGFISQ